MISTTLLSLLITCSATVADSTSDSRMRREADTFLAQLPAGLQEKQNTAIRAAMAGNPRPLTQVRTARNRTFPLPDDVTARDVAPGLRLYTRTTSEKNSDKPLLVYLHGGGWTFGSINSCARFCAELCRTADIGVLAVDYRLAPEHPYPAALNDCTAALKRAFVMAEEWGCSPARICIGGDSSGGNLAIAAALRHSVAVLQDGVRPLYRLLLFYPVVKAWADKSDTWQKYGTGYGLDSSLMETFNQAYAGNAPRRPEISVALAPDSLLRQLPPTWMLSAGRDILAAQGEAFATHLKDLGVDAGQTVFPEAVHLFITVGGQETAFQEAVKRAGHFILNKRP